MKRLCMLISVLVALQGMPLATAAAAVTPARDLPPVFELPAGQVSEPYEVDLETVLSEKYHLKLESDARMVIFQWAFERGDIPPGLSVTTSGKIVGTLKDSYREEPYRFSVRVEDVGLRAGGAALVLEFSLPVARPRIRLTSTEAAAPRLVAVSERAAERDGFGRHARASGKAAPRASAIASSRRAEPDRRATEAAQPAPASETLPSGGRRASRRSRALREAAAAPAAPPVPVPCNEASLPAMHKPTTPDGPDVYRLDARNGNLIDTSNGRIVTSQQRTGKRESTIHIIIDNMNPYLYTYEFNKTNAGVQEQELGPFLKLIGGVVGDILPADESAAALPTAEEPATTGTGGGTESATDNKARKQACSDEATEVMRRLNKLHDDVADALETIGNEIKRIRGISIHLIGEYNAARVPLYTLNRTRLQLYCDSESLLARTAGVVTTGDPNFIDPARLEELKDELAALKRKAARLEAEAQEFRDDFPDCAKQPSIKPVLRDIINVADEAQALVDEYEGVRKEIVKARNDLVAGRGNVERILGNGHAFFEERAIGNFVETTVVTIDLKVTPRPGVTEATPVVIDDDKTTFKFGNAPYFTVSGGLIFSTLRKKEFVRVQGFERDRAGNLVMTNGQPNLTTVIGLEESSPTRINPAVFLNGRIPGTQYGFLDGIHLTLGLTAKNDKEGTDIEYLIGPSLSFFENKMFFTVGGYAGKQQKLEGSFFEGLALPDSVSELPIRKDYRWNVGFALSYRIPGLSK